MTVIVPLLVVLLTGNVLGKKPLKINDVVDHKLKLANNLAVMRNQTMSSFGTGRVPHFFSFETGTCVGLDSMVRTGRCELVFNKHGSTMQVYNVGLTNLACFFSKVDYRGHVGSGYLRPFNNTLYFKYEVVKDGHLCKVQVIDVVLSLNVVKLYISDQAWNNDDDEDFDRDIRLNLLPVLNEMLIAKKDKMEENLKSMLCDQPKKYLFVDGLDVLIPALFPKES